MLRRSLYLKRKMDGRCWCEIEITLARFNWTIIQFFFSQSEKARERGFGLLSLSDGLSLPNKSPHFSPAIAQYCLLLLRQHDVAMLSVSIWYA